MNRKVGMKKRLLVIISLIICIISTACDFTKKNENSNKETSKKIEPIVTVYSVDGGIIQGKYVCQNGNMLAYKDGAGIYLSKDGSEAKKVAEKNGVKSISVNSQHVFCLKKSNSIDVIDLDTNDDGFEKKGKTIDLSDGNDDLSEYFKAVGDDIYVNDGMKVWEIGTGELKEKDGFEYNHNHVVNKEKNIYLYNQKSESTNLLYEGNCISIYGENISLGDESIDIDEVCSNKDDAMTLPEHVATEDDNIYFLTQTFKHLSPREKKQPKEITGNYLIVFNLNTKKVKILYATTSEQICGFSATKNQLFLLDNGKLYVADLEGNNKKEIADLSKYRRLNFEYAADKLWVYRDSTLVMTY